MNQENSKLNHLIHEKSPYLLKHAHNPVNWYPWNEEAFAKAKSEDKPIFLSIGYSTCHWCHVMEHESFEDKEVAGLLNKSFISIKVDKEERPDIDTIYMNVCQALNGHGGWPLTILMAPDQKPFYAGTYLPKHTKDQMFGLMELLETVEKKWKTDRKRLCESGEEIVRQLKSQSKFDEPVTDAPDRRLFGSAFYVLKQQYDPEYGGFLEAPKFPSPHNLLFLLRYAAYYKNETAQDMVEGTLNGMYQGGIYDHIGGGFSRYSTDEKWLVPHFEKMLYDNALLVLSYAEAYQVTKHPLYEKVIRETLQYVMEEMTDENGGFYCAQDADSEGEEGKYYVFTPEEINSTLGKEDGSRFCEYYQITLRGNFEGASIPNRIGRRYDKEEDCQMKQFRQKMYEYRRNRCKLHKDDKILTSWNCLMIAGFVKAYQVLGDVNYLDAARRAYQFISQEMWDENRRLYIRYRDGQRSGLGNLEDYAYIIFAQITLYEVTFDPAYLTQALEDTDEMIRLFWDEKNGGFYYYGSDAENLILRPKEFYDGAMPSGNSMASYVLVKLEKITRRSEYQKIIDRQFSFLNGHIEDYPTSATFALCAMMVQLLEGREIVCVIKNPLDMDELKQLLRDYFLPETVVIPIEEHSADGLEMAAPYTKEYDRTGAESEFYVCKGFQCNPPFTGIEKLKKFMELK